MEFYDVETDINAAPDEVWAILVNSADYTSWDSGVAKVEGTITEGGKIKVFSEISPGRAFPVKVALDRSAGRMTWTGGMPLGLFKGVRTFTVSSRNGGSRFHMREEFTGPLLKLIWKSMPDLSGSFQQFADGLKAEAESPGMIAPGGDPFGALGDPHRRAIVEILADRPRSVRDLAEDLPISRPAVSRHLRLLKDAGLVTDRPVGNRRIYRLHDEGIEAVQSYLRQVWGDALGRFAMMAENTEPRA